MSNLHGVENVTLMSLNQMVDIALGTTNPGVIHFDLLNQALRVLIQKGNLGDVRVQVSGDKSKELLQVPGSTKKSDYTIATSGTKQTLGYGSELPMVQSTSTKLSSAIKPPPQFGEEKFVSDEKHKEIEHTVSITVEQVKWLFDSIQTLQKQVNELKYLPNNRDLIDAVSNKTGSEFNASQSGKKTSISDTPIVDMYQTLQLTRRVDAVEETTEKLASLLEDVIRDFSGPPTTSLMDIESLTELKDQSITVLGNKTALELLSRELTNLKKLVLGDIPKDMKHEETSNAKIVNIEIKIKQLMDQLVDIDRISNNKINEISDRCTLLEETTKSLKKDLDSNADNTNEPITKLSERCDKLEKKMEDVGAKQQRVLDSEQQRAMLMSVLEEQVEHLKTCKVDKEEFIEALEEKLDAKEIVRKVSKEKFMETYDDLKVHLDEAIEKLTAQEELWTRALSELQGEIITKLEKNEMVVLKSFVEDKLKLLHDKIRAMKMYQKEQEAAATKKRLLNLKCLSCDADVSMKDKVTSHDYPGSPRLPPTKTIAPYLTYELDVMRKQQKLLASGRNMHHFEAAMRKDRLENRYCGGPHTVTTPVQRVTRVGHFLEQWGPEILTTTDKLIKGKDGMFYVGTGSDTKFDEKTVVVGSCDFEDVPEKDDSLHKTKFKKIESAEQTASTKSGSSKGILAKHERKTSEDSKKSLEVIHESKTGHVARKISAFDFDDNPDKFPYL